MQKFFRSGNVFFLAALLFLVVSVVSERPAVYISVGVVFFILGLAARKKIAKKATDDPSKN